MDIDGELNVLAGDVNLSGYCINISTNDDNTSLIGLQTTDANIKINQASIELEASDEILIKTSSQAHGLIGISDDVISLEGKLNVFFVKCLATPSVMQEEAWIFESGYLYYNDDGDPTELATVSDIEGIYNVNQRYFILNPIQFASNRSQVIFLMMVPAV